MSAKSKAVMAKAYALGDDGKVRYIGLREVSAEGRRRLAALIEERKGNPEIRPMSDADISSMIDGIWAGEQKDRAKRGAAVSVRKGAAVAHA